MSPMLDEIIKALKRARAAAMEQAVMARIPECGKFGDIAQDLDWAVSMLEVEQMNQGANP